MANTVDKVLKIALEEVGYLEKKSNAQLYDKTANAGYANYTKYGKEMHDVYPSIMDFPASWCDAFCDWCFYKAYGITTAKSLIGGAFNDYTVSSAQMYKNKGAWYTSNPQIGDQIFFKNSSRICHTGLVYKVDNTYVYTIEGNTSSGDNTLIANGGGVFKKKYYLNNTSIAGYGRPKYDIEPKYTIGWNKDDTGWWYSPEGYTYYANEFSEINSETYYFDENGYAVIGWRLINNYWYYFNKNNCMLRSKWLSIDGKDYYFLENGVMATNVYIISDDNKSLYWVCEDGAWDSTKDLIEMTPNVGVFIQRN